MNIPPTCPRCGWTHAPNSSTTIAGSRFTRPIAGYQSRLGGPVRATREEADADYCATKRGSGTWTG